jgi:hypothetical protein
MTPSINNEKYNNNNTSVFNIQPLDLAISDFIAHIKLWNSSSLGSHYRDKSYAIGDNLKKCNVKSIAIATDGEKAYQRLHIEAFRLYQNKLGENISDLMTAIDDLGCPVNS